MNRRNQERNQITFPGETMCGFYGPGYDEIVVASATLPFIAYDVLLGSYNFFQWSQAKKLQSFKALGIAAVVACCAGGFIFGTWPRYYGPDLDRAALTLLVSLSLLFFYPTYDFIFSRNKKLRSYLLKLPVALLGIWICMIAYKPFGLPVFLMDGEHTIWDPWIYEQLLKGPNYVPPYTFFS